MASMRVLIDAHMVGQKETGNETYIAGLLQGLHRQTPDIEILVATTDPGALRQAIDEPDSYRLIQVSGSASRRLLLEFPRIAKRYQIDLIHMTYFCPPRISCAVVTSVHDICFRHHPEWFSMRDRLVLNAGVGLSCRKSNTIITISDYSRQDLCEQYGLSAETVRVTRLACDKRFEPAGDREADAHVLSRYNVTRPYVFALGNLQPRKNLPRLLQAFRMVKEREQIPHRLILAGQPKYRESEIGMWIDKLGLEDSVRCTGYVHQDDLPALYRRADVFVYPSLFEGFGLPVLEAMACGTPVLASDRTSIPEVAGDAARLVDPERVEDICVALKELVLSPKLRLELADRGVLTASRFSWAQTADETARIYRDIIGNKNVSE